jgi:hypothetical protein
MKIEWLSKLTPEIMETDDPIFQQALDWWHSLPIQNLQDMRDSWVGYLWKYFPKYDHPYHLTVEEIIEIYQKEHEI